MSTCPNGHDVDGGLQYCDECGARITGAPASDAADSAPPPPRSWLCEGCNTTQSHSRFCEACGEANPQHPDFIGTGVGAGSAAETDDGPPATPDEPEPVDDAAELPEPSAATCGWTLTAVADYEYYSRIKQLAGPDAGEIVFPVVYQPRRFELTGERLFIGRRSRSRGIEPDIDLSGAPLDPGVSHSHAAIVAVDDGWAIVDVGSSNGTYLNGASEPIPQGTPHRLSDGDHILLGAWTRLTVTAD